MDKKDKVIKMVLEGNLVNQGRIYQLLKNDVLNKILSKVNNIEYFLNNINNFITYFDNNFIPLQNKDECIILTLENQYPEFLINKECYFDKDKLLIDMKRTIVINFYNNILFIYKDIPNKKWHKLHINDNMNIDDPKDINILMNVLKRLVWSNIGCSRLYCLFCHSKNIYSRMKPNDKKNISLIKNLYIEEYNIMINNCFKNDVYSIIRDSIE